MSRSKLTIGLIAATFGLGLPSAAAAAEFPTIRVSYADLDLGSPAGVTALDRRIQVAARRLCSSHLAGDGAWGAFRHRRCVASTLQDARPQVQQVVARANGIQLARRTSIAIRAR